MLVGELSLAVGELERLRNTLSTTTVFPEIDWPFEIIFENYPIEAEELKATYDMALRKTDEGQQIIELYNEWCPIVAFQRCENAGGFLYKKTPQCIH